MCSKVAICDVNSKLELRGKRKGTRVGDLVNNALGIVVVRIIVVALRLEL